VERLLDHNYLPARRTATRPSWGNAPERVQLNPRDTRYLNYSVQSVDYEA
jgi:hypothetical protein